MTHALSVLIGLLGLVALKLQGDALSRWLGVSVPGSFWGFLMLLLALSGVRSVPTALSSASAWLLNHLTLFLLPMLLGLLVAGDTAHQAVAVAAVFLTGLFGALLTPWALCRAGVVDEQIHAFALGVSAHAIGLARAQAQHPAHLDLVVAGMCGNALATALLCSLFLF